MAVTVDGDLPAGVTAKDIVLAIIARIGTGGGIGSIIEYRGSAIRGLSMEGRMTVCNMSIEAGARAGLVAPDDTTFAYLEGRPFAPTGAAWEQALDDWRTLATDDGATFDKEVVLDAAALRPSVTWGTNPAQSVVHRRRRARPRLVRRRRRRATAPTRALAVHGPEGGHADPRHRRRHRLHRLVHELAHRGPARRGRGRAEGRTVRDGVRALVVPGSMQVKAEAEAEGLRRGVHRRRLRVARGRAARCAWR